MSMNPVIHDFDIHKLIIKKPLFIKKSIICNIKYNKVDDLIIQTPLCFLPFCIKEYESGQKKVTFCTTDYIYNNLTKKFISNLQVIENTIQKSYKNITSIIKQNKDNQFVSSLYLNSNKKNFYIHANLQKDYVNIYNQYNEIENEDYIMAESQCYSLIRLKNIWINDEKYGLNWEILQLKIYPPIYKLNQCFIEDPILQKGINLQYKNHPIYSKYFKMKRVGVPIQSIQLDMLKEDLDATVILKDENEYMNMPSIKKGKGKGILPPPPPPPPPPLNNSKKSSNSGLNIMNVLKDLGTVNLKKIQPEKKQRKADINVPSLQEILLGKKNLKKIK